VHLSSLVTVAHKYILGLSVRTGAVGSGGGGFVSLVKFWQ